MMKPFPEVGGTNLRIDTSLSVWLAFVSAVSAGPGGTGLRSRKELS